MRAFEVMSTPVITVAPETSLAEAARIMAERDIRGMPVCDASGDVVGIISETDLLRYETEAGEHLPLAPAAKASPPRGTVAEAMTTDLLVIDESALVSEVAEALLDAKVSRVPVLRHGRLEGIITRRDLLRHLMRRDQALRAEVLQLLKEAGVETVPEDLEVCDGTVTLTVHDERERGLAQMVLQLMPDAFGFKIEVGRHTVPA